MATILTVHGTFASGEESGEKWWQKGSDVERDLREFVESEDGELNFQPVIWDGKNSETSRRKAGCKLLDAMLRLEEKGERYCVVGHSHGGSVIVSALGEATARNEELPNLCKWITVGTPFIDMVKERFLYSRLSFMGKSAYISFVTLPLLVLIAGIAFAVTLGGEIPAIDPASAPVAAPAPAPAAAPVPELGAELNAEQSPAQQPPWVDDILAKQIAFSIYAAIAAALFIVPFIVFYVVLLAINNHGLHVHSPAINRLTKARFYDRWIPLYHTEDEAISGLGAIESVKPNIFKPDFAVPIFSLFTVYIIPIAILILASWPWAMNNVFALAKTTGMFDHIELTAAVLLDENKQLIGGGEYFGRNILLMASLVGYSLFLVSYNIFGSAFAGPFVPILFIILVFFVIPGAFFVVSTAMLYVINFVAGLVSAVMSRSLDSMTWAQLRASAMGNDTDGEVLVTARPRPMWASHAPPPLPDEVGDEVKAFSDRTAAEAVPKFRSAVKMLAMDEGQGNKHDVVTDYLSWPELIHTAYFRVAKFRKLLVYAMAQTTGLRPKQSFKSATDFPAVQTWYTAISTKSADANKPIDEIERSYWHWSRNDIRGFLFIPLFFLFSARYQVKDVIPDNSFWITFEELALPISAAVGALFGMAGMMAVAIGNIPMLYDFYHGGGELMGASISIQSHSSLGYYAAAVSLAYLFGQKARARAVFATNTVSFRQAVFLLVPLTIAFSTYRLGGYKFNTGALEFVFLVVFLFGLSRVSLKPLALAVATIGLISTALTLVDRNAVEFSDTFLKMSGSELLYVAEGVWLILSHPAVWIPLLFTLFLGRGMRLRAYGQKPIDALERFSWSMCSLTALSAIVALALIHQATNISFSVGLPGENGPSPGIGLDPSWWPTLLLIGFCIGVLYLRTGVIVATTIYAVFGILLPLALAMTIGGAFHDWWNEVELPKFFNFISFDMLYGSLLWIGRDSGLIACALLGWAVAARTNNLNAYKPSGATVQTGPLGSSKLRLLPQATFAWADIIFILIGLCIWGLLLSALFTPASAP